MLRDGRDAPDPELLRPCRELLVGGGQLPFLDLELLDRPAQPVQLAERDLLPFQGGASQIVPVGL